MHGGEPDINIYPRCTHLPFFVFWPELIFLVIVMYFFEFALVLKGVIVEPFREVQKSLSKVF